MAPRQRDPPPAPGLLASAFTFVARELESFVTAATGGEVQPKPHQQNDQPQASSSRVTLDGKRRERDDLKAERERERRGKRVRKRSEVESERVRARRRVRREDDDGSDDDRDRAVRAMRKKVQPPPRASSSEREAADDEDDEHVPPPPPKNPAKKRREAAPEEPAPAENVANAIDEPAPLPSKKKSTKSIDKSSDVSQLMPPPPTPMRPPPSPAASLMTPAPTMPGSLFPRSASLMPEPMSARHQRTVPRPRTPPPPPPEPIAEADEAEAEGEPVEDEPEQPPPRERSRDRRTGTSADRETSFLGHSAGDEPLRRSEGSSRAASSSRRSLDEPAEPAPKPRSTKGKERACDTSGEIRVRGKERELREAREDHARNAHERDDGERERDKRRIRMLEEEVARLRAELALKTSTSMMPPPPPPPPPPPLLRTQVPTAESGSENFLASARANLKRTAPPVENPINSAAYGGARTKKTGQPTVNVPSDKMAAFLREMKNVRLRRVGGLTGSGVGSTSMSQPATTAGVETDELNRSLGAPSMSRARMAATLGERSFDLGVATRLEIGQKRKRDAADENGAGPSKRRETAFLRPENTGGSSSASSSLSSASSSQSSASSSQSSASSSQPSSSSSTRPRSSSRTTVVEMLPPRSRPSRPGASAPLRIWPTTSTAETDLTTPSLCSDNENEHEHEDRLPDTPSDNGRRRVDPKSETAHQREPEPVREPVHEVIDVDALETPPKQQAAPEPPGDSKKNVFARRVPESPLPASPDKPRPPARAARSKIPLPLPRRVPIEPQRPPEDESDSDDPLSAPLSRPQSRAQVRAGRDEAPRAGPSRVRRELSPSPSLRGARGERSESRMSNHARRRLTLDEELRRAGDSLWQPSEDEAEPEPEPEEPDVDSGELVALGTRSSKRGFLARGGGAGPPVFMGEGYVQGAVAEDRPGRRSRSNTGESSRRSGSRR